MRRRTDVLTRVIILSAASIGASAPPAPAHPVSLVRGDLEVRADRAILRLEFPAEDLLHGGHLRACADDLFDASDLMAAAGSHRISVADGLYVRDGAGRRLLGTPKPATLDLPNEDSLTHSQLTALEISHRVEYALPPHARFLTLQQRYGGAAPAMLTRFALNVHGTRMRQPCPIVLTSGGNVETLELQPPQSRTATSQPSLRAAGDSTSDAGRAWLGHERFKTACAIVSTSPREIVIRVFLPATTSETWSRIDRENPDFISPGEQRAALEPWRRRLAAGIAIKLDGAGVKTDVDTIGFLGPDDSAVSGQAEARRLGLWSARIGAEIRVRTAEPAASLRLDWSMFNSAVMTWRVLVLDGPEASEFRLSSYAPTLSVVLSESR